MVNIKDILLNICNERGYLNYNKYGITIELIVDVLCSDKPLHSTLCKTYSISKNTATTALKHIFYDRVPKVDHDIKLWLLSMKNLKLCNKCKSLLNYSYYYTNSSKPKGYNSLCKECSRKSRMQSYYKDPNKEIVNNKIRKLNKRYLQTPLWANISAIKEFYSKTPTGFHVDHIIPLNSNIVCGLHVLENLQYLTIEENLKKSNKYNIE